MRLKISSLFILFVSLFGCATHPPLSPVSAETLAAKIANEKCAKEFGEAPFKPEDFAAELNEGRWHWGTENGSPVDGYEIEVSFLPDGGDKQVVIRGQNRE